jgi:hypothetical protein
MLITASGLRSLHHCGGTPALTPTGDYLPRASRFPGRQRQPPWRTGCSRASFPCAPDGLPLLGLSLGGLARLLASRQGRSHTWASSTVRAMPPTKHQKNFIETSADVPLWRTPV